MGPENYIIQVQQPFQAALQGYQAASAIRQDQLQQQQQQAALDQQRNQQQVLQTLLTNPNPTADDYSRAIVQVPGLAEQLKQSWSMRSSEQQQADLSHITEVYSALSAGSPEMAEMVLRRRADALRNSGKEQEAKNAETMAEVVKINPTFAQRTIGMKLAAVPGGDKVIESIGKIGTEQRAAEQAPAELRTKIAGADKAEADAETAKVAAKYADQAAVMDLQKKGWDIKKVVADIETQREANRIAAMNAATAREGNQLKREELQLKVKEARQALDDKIRAKVADAESAASSMDNFLNTVQRVRNVAVGKDGKPTATLRAAAGPIDSRMPTVQTDVADLEALVETMGSQAFLSQIPAMKGTGSLTEREGDKLQSSLSNLSLKQSPEQLIENINEAFRLINKARQNLSTRTGVPLPPPDIPSARPKNGTTDFQAPAGGGATTTTKGGATVSTW